MTEPVLFTPFRVRNVDLINRIVIAPMCQYSAVDGCMTDWHLIHLGHLALSGAALLTIGVAAPREANAMPLAPVATGPRLADNVAYFCRPVWRCGPYACGWSRFCGWRPGPYAFARPYWGWHRPWVRPWVRPWAYRWGYRRYW